MRKEMFKCIAASLALMLGVSSAAAQGIFRSDCTGTVVEENTVLRLEPEACKQYHLVLKRRLVGCKQAVWCFATLGWDGTSIRERVKAACNVGDRCRVKGLVQGRGAFEWTEITSVKKLSNKR
jgi:hypothetical protein